MEKITSLVSRIKGHRVYLDTNSLIYFIEKNSEFFSVISPIFELIGTSEIFAYSSELTLTEILTKPIRDKHIQVIESYTELLFDEELITLICTSRNTFLLAAKISAELSLRTPDAIHMASAVERECRFFITNDKKIKSYNNTEVLYVSDFP